jgi:hypothetical protein
MTTPPTVTETEPAPPQPTFPHTAYGVELSWLGEDGGMVAKGHIPDLRFIAACNHLARKDIGLSNIWDDPCAQLDDALKVVIRAWAIPTQPCHGFEWEIAWHGITEQTPGAIPITVLWP